MLNAFLSIKNMHSSVIFICSQVSAFLTVVPLAPHSEWSIEILEQSFITKLVRFVANLAIQPSYLNFQVISFSQTFLEHKLVSDGLPVIANQHHNLKF